MERKFIEKEGSRFYSEGESYKWFYRRIVSEQQVFPLCGQDIPSFIIPQDFFVLFKVKTSEEEIIARLAYCAVSEVVQRAYSQDRNALRSEKERPWGLRTYRPFRGQLQDAKPPFTKMLKFAEELIAEIGMPMFSKSRER